MLLSAIVMMALFTPCVRAQRAREVFEVPAREPLFAVTTNVLYESASAITGFHSFPLTIGLEMPVARRWSIYSNFIVTAPWRAWNDNADCAQLMHADLGGKWFLREKYTLTGWYTYGAIGGGYYDLERNGKGYQGEELLVTLGMGYGLKLSTHWSLDFALGLGPMFTWYRYYEKRPNSEYLMFRYNGQLTYFGITDAKVSLRYLICRKKK